MEDWERDPVAGSGGDQDPVADWQRDPVVSQPTGSSQGSFTPQERQAIGRAPVYEQQVITPETTAAVNQDWTTGAAHLPPPPGELQRAGDVSDINFFNPRMQAAWKWGQEQLGEAAKLGHTYTNPWVLASRLAPPGSTVRQMGEAVPEAAKQLTSGLVTPENVAIAAAFELAAPAAPILARIGSTGFSAWMASELPETWRAFKEAPDVKTKTEIALQGTAQLVFAAGAGIHGVSGLSEYPRIRVPRVEPPPPEVEVPPIPPERMLPGGEPRLGLPEPIPGAELPPPVRVEGPAPPVVTRPAPEPVRVSGPSAAPEFGQVQDWFSERMSEGRRLGEQERLAREAGLPIPKSLQDDIDANNAAIKRGFPLPEERRFVAELPGEPLPPEPERRFTAEVQPQPLSAEELRRQAAGLRTIEQPLGGEEGAVKQGYAQVETPRAALGVEKGPAGPVAPAGDRYNAVREAERTEAGRGLPQGALSQALEPVESQWVRLTPEEFQRAIGGERRFRVEPGQPAGGVTDWRRTAFDMVQQAVNNDRPVNVRLMDEVARRPPPDYVRRGDVYEPPDWAENRQAVKPWGERLKNKINAQPPGGFVPNLWPEIFEFGRHVYQRGMDYARWGREMLGHLGERIRRHLGNIWDNIQTYFKEGGYGRTIRGRETGAVGEQIARPRITQTGGYTEFEKMPLPGWAREEMGRRGIPTGRTFNDIDLADPRVREAIQTDPTLTDAQKSEILKKGGLSPAQHEVVADPSKDLDLSKPENFNAVDLAVPVKGTLKHPGATERGGIPIGRFRKLTSVDSSGRRHTGKLDPSLRVEPQLADMRSVTEDAPGQLRERPYYVPSKLGEVGLDPKTVKGEKKGFKTFIMYLAAHTQAGIETAAGKLLNVCKFATKECSGGCLGRGGMGSFDSVKSARANKTRFFHYDEPRFMGKLDRDITREKAKARAARFNFAIRLNGTSDVLWEQKGIMEKHPDVQFYDYTKYPSVLRKNLPDNYDLTYSYTGLPGSEAFSRAWNERRVNTAVVFAGGMPHEFLGRPVIDGDFTDLRFLDPKGVIVGLHTKGPLLQYIVAKAWRIREGRKIRVFTKDPPAGAEEGYITSQRKFYTPKEAWKHGVEIGQFDPAKETEVTPSPFISYTEPENVAIPYLHPVPKARILKAGGEAAIDAIKDAAPRAVDLVWKRGNPDLGFNPGKTHTEPAAPSELIRREAQGVQQTRMKLRASRGITGAVGMTGGPRGRPGRRLEFRGEPREPLEFREAEPPAEEPVRQTPPADAPTATGISNARLEEIYGKDAVAAGRGRSAKAWKAAGAADPRDPYQVLSAARQKGIATPLDTANLRTEHKRLLDQARAAWDTPRYDALAQRANDFGNAVKGVAHGPASDVMRALQEDDIPTYTSPADFDAILRDRHNRESTQQEKKTFERTTTEVRKATTATQAAATEGRRQLRRTQPRLRKPVSFEDASDYVRNHIADLLKDCV
jgi:hypothetical protein